MFLRNGWYTALWSHELKDKPVAKTLLNEKIVLFRNADGDVGALEDCCCHRAAPLSLGEISGDYLACGYHGLKFDVNGKCVEVPGQTQVPSSAKVRSYPVAEKWNVVWIWMGDPAKADPGKIPDMPWLSEPKWTATPGRLHVKSNYQFIIDNLLDFTHVAHVHKRTIAGDPREATEPIEPKGSTTAFESAAGCSTFNRRRCSPTRATSRATLTAGSLRDGIRPASSIWTSVAPRPERERRRATAARAYRFGLLI